MSRAAAAEWGNRIIRSQYFVLLLSLGYFLALAPYVPGFASWRNFESVLTTLLPLLLLAIGQTFVLVSGGIDLSITSTVALASVVGGLAMNLDSGWLGAGPMAVPVGVALMLATGAAVGCINGLSVTRLQMPPFIVTLTTMMFFSGLAVLLTQSKGIGNLPSSFLRLGNQTLFALSWTALAALLAHAVLSRTLFGRWLYAVGHNLRTARVSGVPTERVTTGAYALSGLFAALAAILLTAQTETASPVLGQRMLLDVLAATVIGGVSLFGGKGKILWALCGVVFIRLLDNSLNLVGLTFFAILIVKGCVILLAAVLDAWRNSAALRLAER